MLSNLYTAYVVENQVGSVWACYTDQILAVGVRRSLALSTFYFDAAFVEVHVKY